jgi:serine/threonine protein kinase
VDRVANDLSTDDLSTNLGFQAGAEPIAGYRLVSILGRGGFGEVWKCEAPGGLFKAMKVLHGDLDLLELSGTEAEQEWEALQRVKGLRHPFLLAMDRIEVVEGRLLIVSELADCNLADELARRKSRGHRGLERGQLLSYLREAAEVLDWLNIEHGLQHLDIKPGNLFLVSNHVKVGDFGLMRSVKESKSDTCLGQRVVTTTPRYAPPETTQGVICPCSDQYSLALVYYELLTGDFPFDGGNARQLALQHAKQPPDLDALPDTQKPIVARALAKEPRERFPTCSAFVEAIQQGRGVEFPSRHTINDLGEWNTPLPQSPSATTPPPQLLTTPPVVSADRAGQGVLPGYQFLECMGRGSLGEVWKVQTPERHPCMARIIVNPVFGAKSERDVLAKLEEAGHPGVIPWRVATRTPERLILLADASGRTLHDHYKARRTVKEMGLPRGEVVACLRQVAATVDRWSELRKLHHLGLSPRTIFWTNDKAQVVDAGLTQLLGLAGGHNLFELSARYAAPELADDRFSAASDVFSLAVLYYELVTGQMPHRAQGVRQMLQARREGVPGLDLLPGRDRFAVARALEPNPARRFASCMDFVQALEGGVGAGRREAREVPNLPSLISTQEEDALGFGMTPVMPSPEQFVADLVAAASALLETPTLPGQRGKPDPVGALFYKGGARMSPETARLVVKEFCKQWQGRMWRSSNEFVEFEVEAPQGWWQKLRGQKGGLRVRIELQRPTVKGSQLTEVAIRMEPVGCTAAQAEGLLRNLRLSLLQGLREKLDARSEQRIEERTSYPYPLRVIPILADRSEGDVVVCHGKDVSLRGVGIVSAQPFRAQQIYVQPTVPSGRFHGAVLARIVRVQERADGMFETGAIFTVQGGPQGPGH